MLLKKVPFTYIYRILSQIFIKIIICKYYCSLLLDIYQVRNKAQTLKFKQIYLSFTMYYCHSISLKKYIQIYYQQLSFSKKQKTWIRQALKGRSLVYESCTFSPQDSHKIFIPFIRYIKSLNKTANILSQHHSLQHLKFRKLAIINKI